MQRVSLTTVEHLRILLYAEFRNDIRFIYDKLRPLPPSRPQRHTL